MTTTLIATSISSILISLSALQANFIDEFLFRYHTQKGNEYYEQNYLESAEEEFSKADQYANETDGTSELNLGIAAYEQQRYQNAQQHFRTALETGCSEDNLAFCNQAQYNLGNTLYRIGQSTDTVEETKQYWQQAIDAYSQALTADEQDTLAEENKQFVEQQLQQLEQEQQQEEEQSEEQDSGEEGESEQSEENESEERDAEEEPNANESDDEGNQQNEQNGGARQTPQNNSGLSEEESKRLDQYMDQLEQEEQNLDDYFYRNGENTQPSSPFDQFLNDPFFGGNLFDDIFEQGFGQENENDTEKDW